MSSVSAAYMVAADQKRRSSAQSPKSSFESARSVEQRRESALKKAARKVIKAAKDHHNSVNLAFESYYSPMTPKTQSERVEWR